MLAFSGDVTRAAHLLLTHHVRCPYDGALVHEDELPVGVYAADLGTSARRPLPVSAVPRHEHQECDAFSAVHRLWALVAPAQFEARRADVAVQAAPFDEQRGVSRSVLSYAPKLSPPA